MSDEALNALAQSIAPASSSPPPKQAPVRKELVSAKKRVPAPKTRSARIKARRSGRAGDEREEFRPSREPSPAPKGRRKSRRLAGKGKKNGGWEGGELDFLDGYDGDL